MDDRPSGSRDKTLTDEDIVCEARRVGRRRAVELLGVSALGAVATVTGCGSQARPQVATPASSEGITDRDEGACADPAGRGRGDSGLTDGDQGTCSDPAGRGRRGSARVSDSDAADAAGQGRTGITDNDSGPSADPAGQGRGVVILTE